MQVGRNRPLDLPTEDPLPTMAAMQIDWITWSVFATGAAMLLYWCVQTIREFRDLFRKRMKQTNHKNDRLHFHRN